MLTTFQFNSSSAVAKQKWRLRIGLLRFTIDCTASNSLTSQLRRHFLQEHHTENYEQHYSSTQTRNRPQFSAQTTA